jgi:hypothetical protein
MAKFDPKLTDSIEKEILAGDNATVIAARYEIPKHRVWTIRTQMKARGIALPLVGQDRTGCGPAAQQEETGDEAQDGDHYKCQLEVPADRLDWIIGNFTLDEALAVLLDLEPASKGWAIEFVLQRRLERIIESPATDEALGDPLAPLWRTTPAGGRVAFAPPDLTHPQPVNHEENHA